MARGCKKGKWPLPRWVGFFGQQSFDILGRMVRQVLRYLTDDAGGNVLMPLRAQGAERVWCSDDNEVAKVTRLRARLHHDCNVIGKLVFLLLVKVSFLHGGVGISEALVLRAGSV